MKALLLTGVFVLVLALPRLHGQAPRSDATPVFEAASVKPNQARTCHRNGSLAGGRFMTTCATLRELMVVAYPRQDGRARFDTEISGGPAWLNSDRFDVVAKVPEGQGIGIDAGDTPAGAGTAAELSAVGRIRQMLQPLLVDRFKLTVHHERRDLPVYELRIDRNDGTLGRQLRKVDSDCVSERGSGKDCGGFRLIEPGHIVAHAATVPMLAMLLETSAGRNVIERTRLEGTFDVELQWTPDRQPRLGAEALAVDADTVSIFTAVREQLGLKLESTKASLDVLVIDRAEKPTPD